MASALPVTAQHLDLWAESIHFSALLCQGKAAGSAALPS